MNKQYYLLELRPKRADFGATITAAEEQIMQRHYQYMGAGCEAGRVILAGRRADATLGIAVLAFDSETDARNFAAKDPAIENNVLDFDLSEFSLAMIRKA